MGVTNLWSILAPVKQHTPLSSLQGQTIAVDLSIWVCENQCVKSMQGVVARPYLRNLFFRVSYLTQLGVRLVFVIEGAAPELKWQEMQRRQQALGRGGGQTRRGGRSHFNARLRECCQLLDLLGVPYIQSQGEAEAMCATLNAAGLVDACITDDGDVFLYGARTVYKNFTMNNKDPHVESYRMASIEQDLGISRESLVGVSLLLGCDYLPRGVPGVGVDRVIKYLDSLKGVDLLKRFQQWSSLSPSQCVSKIEINIRQKALTVPDFPQKQIIAEFMSDQEVVPNRPFVWRRPHIVKSQEYAETKMEWPPDYTTEKILPLLTLWDLSNLDNTTLSNTNHLKPNRIVKPRVRHGVPVYEVEWFKQADDTKTSQEFYVTMEEQGQFGRVFPGLVQELEEENAAKKTKKKTGSKKNRKHPQGCATQDEELSSQMKNLEITENTGSDKETSLQPNSDIACLPVGSEYDRQNLKKDIYGHVGIATKSRKKEKHKSKEVSSELSSDSCFRKKEDRCTDKRIENVQDSVGCAHPKKEIKDRSGNNSGESGKISDGSNDPGFGDQNRERESDSDKDNEDVFLSLSQRLQLKLGQTEKLRSMSNGFEACLALKQNQSKCNSESAVGDVINQRVKAKGQKVQLKQERSVDCISQNVPRPSDSKLHRKGSYLMTSGKKLCSKSDDVMVLSKQNQASSHSSRQNETPDKSYVCESRALIDATIEHDFSYVANMMTIINTPEVIRENKVERTEISRSETSLLHHSHQELQSTGQKSLLSDKLHLTKAQDDLTTDQQVSWNFSQGIPSLKNSTFSRVTPTSSPDVHTSNHRHLSSYSSVLRSDTPVASPQMRTARPTLYPLTPESADRGNSVLPRGMVLLYQTPSPVGTVPTLSHRTTDSSDPRPALSRHQSLVYQTPSPMSLGTGDVTLQFGHFSMQASLLSDSPADLSTYGVATHVPVKSLLSPSRCSESMVSVNDSPYVPSVKTKISMMPVRHVPANTAMDYPNVCPVDKDELLSDQLTRVATRESTVNHRYRVADLDSSFSSLSLVTKDTASKSISGSLQFSNKEEFGGRERKGGKDLQLQQHCFDSDAKHGGESYCDKTVMKKRAVSKYMKHQKYDQEGRVETQEYKRDAVFSDERSTSNCPGTYVFADADKVTNQPVKRKSKLSLKKSLSNVGTDKHVDSSHGSILSCNNSTETTQDSYLQGTTILEIKRNNSDQLAIKCSSIDSAEFHSVIDFDSDRVKKGFKLHCNEAGVARSTVNSDNVYKSEIRTACSSINPSNCDSIIDLCENPDSGEEGFELHCSETEIGKSNINKRSQLRDAAKNNETHVLHKSHSNIKELKITSQVSLASDNGSDSNVELQISNHINPRKSKTQGTLLQSILTCEEIENSPGLDPAAGSPVSLSRSKDSVSGQGDVSESVCDVTTDASPVSLTDRLKHKLSSESRVALQTLSFRRRFGTCLNVKPLNLKM